VPRPRPPLVPPSGLGIGGLGDGQVALTGERLPPFFRADLRLEKRWKLIDGAWLAAVGEVINATLSREDMPTNCRARGCEIRNIGPVTLPSLGIEGGFL